MQLLVLLFFSFSFSSVFLWHHGVAVVTMAQLHSTKPELRFCAGSNSAHYMSEICDGENLWQCSWLEVRFKHFSLVNHSAKSSHYHHRLQKVFYVCTVSSRVGTLPPCLGIPLFLKQILKITPSFWQPSKLVHANCMKHFKMKELHFVLY